MIKETIAQAILRRCNQGNVVYNQLVRERDRKETKKKLRLEIQAEKRRLNIYTPPRRIFSLEQKQKYYQEHLDGLTIKELAEKYVIKLGTMGNIIRRTKAKNIVPAKI